MVTTPVLRFLRPDGVNVTGLEVEQAVIVAVPQVWFQSSTRLEPSDLFKIDGTLYGYAEGPVLGDDGLLLVVLKPFVATVAEEVAPPE